MVFKLLLLKLLLLSSLIVGCNDATIKESFNNVDDTSSKSQKTFNDIDFSGVTVIDQVTDTTVRVNWAANEAAVSYKISNVTSDEAFYVTTIDHPLSSVVLSGLTAGQTYKFHVTAIDENLLPDKNTKKESITTLLKTPAPSLISIVLPASTGYTVSPTIEVGGVKEGDTVKLFSDSSCSTSVGSGVAAGSTLQLITSSLPVGANTIYATSGTSDCSTASVTYTRNSCPGGLPPSGNTCAGIIFGGIDSIDEVTDSTVRLNWTAEPNAVTYKVFNVTSGTPVYVSTINHPTTSAIVTGLTANTLYKFRVRALNADLEADGNTNDVLVTTLANTPAPTGLSIVLPGPTGVSATPTIRVSGVKNNDIVRIFSDAGCSTQVASGTATGSTIDLMTSTLTVGTHNLYATSGTSVCSTATVSYTRSSCPSGRVLSGSICAMSFAGITSIDQITDSTMRINWTSHAHAVSYNLYNVTSGSPVFVTSIDAPAASYTHTGLSAGSAYDFRVKAVDADSVVDENTNDVTATTLANTPSPTGVSVISPGASGYLATPTVRVSGVKSGDTVRIYSDSSCATQVASGSAAGSSIDLVTNSLNFGLNNLYATAGSSSCSTATDDYTRDACPGGYVASGNSCLVSYGGLSSITDVTDSTLTLNWASHADAVSYNIYDVTSGIVHIATVTHPSTSYTVTGLASNTTYSFRVRAVDESSVTDSNTNDLSTTTLALTPTPSNISVISPSASGVTDTPTVRVSGVKNGDTVTLYTDNTCSAQVATGTAAGTSIDFVTAPLPVGTNNFYSTAGTSVCSTATASYVRNSCSSGYVLSSGSCKMSFAGITSIDQVTDSTVRINWSSHADAVSYKVYNTTSGSLSYITSINDPETSTTLTGLSIGTLYKFRVRAVDSDLVADNNTNDVSVTTLSNTPSPTGLTILSPGTSGFTATPTVTVSGVKAGDIVRVFTNNTCSSQVASGTASGSSINLTTSSLSNGANTLYATSGTSSCSTANVTYTVNSCNAGYTVSGNSCEMLFSGISSIWPITDTTLKINWNPHASAVAYNLYDMTSGSAVFIATVNHPTTTYTVTGLTPATNYTYRVRAMDSTFVQDPNTSDYDETTAALTPEPTGMSIVSPGASGVTDTPTLRVSGIKSGDTIKIFSGPGCTTEVGSGVSNGTSIDIVLTSSLSVATHTLHSTAGTSTCSTSSVTYTRNACSAGYVLNSGVCVLNFAGITSIDQVTDSTLRLNWTPHASAVSYEIYNTTYATPSLITTVSGQSSSSITITSSMVIMNPGGTYQFRVRAKDSSGLTESNTAETSVTLNATPDMPSVALLSPAATPGPDSTPTFRISGVKSGDVIKLYSDSSCTTEVASVNVGGATVDITPSALTSGVSYTFAATAEKFGENNPSACSSTTATYKYIYCPAGYAVVPGNSSLGVSDFCIMKVEARDDGGYPSALLLQNAPWVSITANNAKAECTSLNAYNGVSNKYDIISNPEWMTIARHIEVQDSNWTGGAIGNGYLYTGHADGFPNWPNGIYSENPWDSTNDYPEDDDGWGKEQRRTFNLANGEVVWDLSGNVWEWVDWVPGGTFTVGPSTPSCTSNAKVSFDTFNCPPLVNNDFQPLNPLGLPNYDDSYGLGIIWEETGSGAVLRGGDYNNGWESGLYTLDRWWNYDPATTNNTNFGFRCVYRP